MARTLAREVLALLAIAAIAAMIWAPFDGSYRRGYGSLSGTWFLYFGFICIYFLPVAWALLRLARIAFPRRKYYVAEWLFPNNK